MEVRLAYAKTFSTPVTETQEQRNIRMRGQAIRRKLLSNPNGSTERFRNILTKMSDAELVQKEAEHHEECLRFQAAGRMKRTPVTKTESSVDATTRAALSACGFKVGE